MKKQTGFESAVSRMNVFSVCLLAALSMTVVSCGQGQERKATETTDSSSNSPGADGSVSGDSELSVSAVETVMTDSIESLVTQSSSGASLALTSEKEGTDKSVYNRECKVDGNNAVVKISTTMDRSESIERPNVSMSRKISGASSQTRIWSKSKDGAAVAVVCGPNNKAAAIDWESDLAGMKLDLTFERSRSNAVSITNKKRNKTFERSRSFSASGSRTISWGTLDTANTDASIIVREKTVVSNVNRKIKAVNKKGETNDLEFSVKTAADAPLLVRVERDKTTKALKKKTIKTGTVVATRVTDGRIESTFSDVVLTFDGDKCVGDSGSVLTKFYAEGGTEAVKSLKLTIQDGVYSLTDALTGEDKGEIDAIGCDAEDFAN